MNAAEIRVRTASLADAHAIASFNAAMAEETEGKTLDPRTSSAGVLRALNDPARARYFIAELDGAIAGQTMITVEWSDWRNAYFWWIQSVYIDPPYRRRGVFRALHRHIRAEARDRIDVCGIRLYAHRENASALRTYAALGMTRTDYLLLEEEWSGETHDR